MSKNLTPQQSRALACLLTAKDVKSAARSAGVGYRTLTAWLENEGFQTALRKAENQVVDRAVRRVTNLSSKALDYLEALLDNTAAGENNRLRAALALVDWSIDNRIRNDTVVARSSEQITTEWYERELTQAATIARTRLLKQREADKLSNQ